MRPGQLTSFCATLPVADCREGKVSCKRKIPPAHVMLQPQQRQQRRGDLRFLATIPLSRVLTGRRMAGGGGVLQQRTAERARREVHSRRA